MKMGLGFYPSTYSEDALSFAKQIGVSHIMIHIPSAEMLPSAREGYWSAEDLQALVRQVEGHGLKLEAIENFEPRHWAHILTAGPKREEQMDTVKRTIENLGKATVSLTEEQKAAEAAFDAAENEIDAMLAELRRQEQQTSSKPSSSSSNTSSGSSGGSSSSKPSGGSESAYNFMWPSPNYHYITSPFGYRIHPITGVRKLHAGCDIGGSGINGTPIYAADSGTVSLATYNAGGYGNYVMLYHGTKSDGKQYATLYAHMTRYVVSAGQKVQKGDVIGYVGSTGASTAPHLHFEIRVNGTPVNPLLYF